MSVSQASPSVAIRTTPRPSCYLCGAAGELRYQGLTDRLYDAPGRWDLRKCANAACGLLWLDPQPVAADVGQLYRSYYTHTHEEQSWPGIGWPRPLRFLYYCLGPGRIYQALREEREYLYLKQRPPGRLLDVGCGNGAALARLRTLGWTVEGQEVDARAAVVARATHGVVVHVGALEKLALPAEAYDAVTLSHVLEHVLDPVGLLRECCRLLRPGGVLVVITPNARSHGHRYFGAYWRGLEVPRHLYLFSPRTLREAARRAGFQAMEVWTNPAAAQWFALASLEIRDRERGAIPRGLTVWRRLWALGYQWWALAVHRWNRDSGDECVLYAYK